MKRFVAVLLIAVLCTAAACAGLAKGTVKIRIAYYADETPHQTMLKIINEFKKENPGIQVEVSHSDWDGHYEKLKAELAAGAGPTIYLLDSVYIQAYARQGILEDLSTKIKQFSKAKYAGLDAVKDPGGKTWAVPQGIQINVLYYNKDMFDKAGVEYPTADWTYDDLATAAQKMTIDTNGDGKIDQWGVSLPPHVRYGWYTLIRGFGGDIMDKTRTKSTVKSDPAVREALQFQYDTMYKWKCNPTPRDAEGALTTKYHTYFARKLVAMFMDNYSRKVMSDEAGLNYDIQLQPKGPGPRGKRYSSIVANSWVVNKSAGKAEKDAGWKFIRFYMSDKGQSMYAKAGESLPANRKICEEFLKSVKKPAHALLYLESMKYADTLGENACWEEWLGVFNEGLQDFFAGKEPLDETLVKLDKGLQKVLDDCYKK